MDGIDEEILEILDEDGRASFTKIANDIGVSEGTVRNRVNKLEDEDIIKGFTVEIDKGSVMTAFVSVDITTEEGFNSVLDDFPQDVEMFELAGDTDLLVKISRKNSSELNDVVDTIRAVGGVEDTSTHMVLSERV
jgi:Transcriptional regulators